jgi:hypothetical protein
MTDAITHAIVDNVPDNAPKFPNATMPAKSCSTI